MNRRHFSVLLLALAASAPLHAEWKFKANRYDLRTATTTATCATPDGPAKARLVVQYSPGKNGTLSIELIIEGAREMKGFGFEPFEGPDAPAASQKLTRIVVERTGKKPLTLETPVGGWYAEDGFHFNANEVNERPGDVGKTVRAIQAGATKVSFTVRDSKNPKKQLHADFDTEGAADALATLLK